MKEKRYCPYCRADITAEQKFCGSCWKIIPEVPVAPIVEEHSQPISSSDEAKLREIVSNPALYKASLVEACKKELQIRQEAEILIGEVEGYPDTKISEILSSPEVFSDALVYCCQKVKRERLVEQRKAEADAEKERQRLRQEKSKNWIKVSVVVILIVSLIISLFILYFRFDPDDPEFTTYVNLNEYGEMIKYVWRSLLGK